MGRETSWWTPHTPSPAVALAVAVGAVSTSAILVRESGAPSVVIGFYRALFTTAFLVPLAIARHREAFRGLSRRDYVGAGAAGLALALHFAAWFESLRWTSVAASVTILQAQVVLVTLAAALLFAERITARTVVGTALALGGIVIMSIGSLFDGTGASAPLYGDALAVVAAVCMAGYVLTGRSLRQRVPLIPYVVVVYGVSAIALLGFALADGAPLVAYPPREWALFVGMAVGPGIVGHTLLNWALAHVKSSVVSASLLAEPVGSTVLAFVILHEVPTAATVIGGIAVLIGVAVTS